MNVEDHAITREGIVNILSRTANMTVVAGEDGEQAVSPYSFPFLKGQPNFIPTIFWQT
jgi:DNA-binding NarL/FixJ family response regulator